VVAVTVPVAESGHFCCYLRLDQPNWLAIFPI